MRGVQMPCLGTRHESDALGCVLSRRMPRALLNPCLMVEMRMPKNMMPITSTTITTTVSVMVTAVCSRGQ